MITALTLTRQLKRPSTPALPARVRGLGGKYAAAPFYEFYGHRLLQTVFAAGDFLSRTSLDESVGVAPASTVGRLRVAVRGNHVRAGYIHSCILQVRPRRRRLWRPMTLWRALSEEVQFALVLLIATVLVGPVSIYGGEMLIRTELFSLPRSR